MRRARAVIAVALTLIAVVAIVVVAVAAGGDDEAATTSPAPSGEAPSATPAQDAPGAFPPEFLECMARRGFPIESPAELHSAPPEVLQECFGALHQGGGAP